MKKPPKKMETKQRETKHSSRQTRFYTPQELSRDDDDEEEEEEEEQNQFWKSHISNINHGKRDGDDDSSGHDSAEDESSDPVDDGRRRSRAESDHDFDEDESSDSVDDGRRQSKVASFLTCLHDWIHHALKLIILFCVVVCGVIIYHDSTSKQAGPSVFCRTGHPGPPFEIRSRLALSDGQNSGGTAQPGPPMVECLPCPPHATCKDHDRQPTCDGPTYVLDASKRACIRDVGLARNADDLLKKALHLAQVQKGDSKCGVLDSALQPLKSQVQEEAMRAKLSESFASGDFSFEDVYSEMKQRIRQGNLGLFLRQGAYESERMVQSMQCRVQEVFKAHRSLIIQFFLLLCGLLFIYGKIASCFRRKKRVKVLTKKVVEYLKQEAQRRGEYVSLRTLKGMFAKGKHDRAIWKQVVTAVRKKSVVKSRFRSDRASGRKREFLIYDN